MKSFLSLAVFLFVAVARALSSGGSRLLVILENLEEKSAYTKFFGDLESRCFKIAYETPKSESVSLFRLGERLYDHVILFPIKAKGLGPNLTAQLFVQFINAQGNLLLALSSAASAPTAVIGLLGELDISLPVDRTGLVVDHFNYDTASAAEQHDVLLLPPPGQLRADTKNIFGPEKTTDALLALPHTVGHVLGAGSLLAPIVRASRTAYSYNPKEEAEVLDENVFAVGQQLSLVSSVQARNSARVAVVGSAELFSDKWFDAKVKKSGNKKAATVATYNREFAKKLSGWAFHETGVLRVNSVEHHLNEKTAADNVTNPAIYRIKNDVTYTISVSEYSWDKWTPFVVPASDELQLEFSMLSPFHRLPLKHDQSKSSSDAAAYSVSFKLPDQHGIFNFRVNYKRPFLSNVDEKNTVSVRHMAHDEWARSYAISGAWPWIAGIAATITGWLGFCAVWMFSQPTRKPSIVKKNQ